MDKFRLLECSCCQEKPLPCPFCGAPGMIFGENMIGCSEIVQCGGQVDFGHHCGVENGIPAVHWVIKQWNKRIIPDTNN